MYRSRFTLAACALGLGLMSGCFSLHSHPLFQKRAASADCECAGPGLGGVTEGPIVEGGTVTLPPAPSDTVVMPPMGSPPASSPPPPRLIPQPQAPTAPYVPR
jgi:hypothetical protein